MFSESLDYVVGSLQDVKDAIVDCAGDGYGLIPLGGGVQRHIGHDPTRECRTLTTKSLHSIVEYNPDDLVVVTEAGMSLSKLQSELSRAGQWLPIEVAHPEKQTLGGIVSTRANSQIRSRHGSVRDWLIGVEAVNASGETVVGGGRVVKNVSGYDLPKLYCGSWGTLGIVMRTNFKVAPLPEADRSLLVILSNDRNSEELIDILLNGNAPSSTLLFNASASKRLLGEDATSAQYLLIRFMGIHEDVERETERCATACEPFASSVLALPNLIAQRLTAKLRDFPLNEAPLTARYHILSSQVGAYARMVEWIALRVGLRAEVVSEAASGVVTAHFYPEIDDIDWQAFRPLFQDKADRVGGSLIVERMPKAWREAGFPVWSPILPDQRLMALIKRNLDPSSLFSPGRFMGGI